MANILISNRCNRRCSFCFARQRLGKNVKSGSDVSMPLDDIRKIMSFLETSGDKTLRLLGGEPTLHPEFDQIVLEAIQKGFHVHVFTNGFMSRDKADFLSELPDEKITFLCNVSPQARDSNIQKEKLMYSLQRLRNKVRLGITISSLDTDFDFLIEYINGLKLQRRVRVGIAQPIVGQENEYLRPSQYREAGRFIVEMAKKFYSENILIGFDCGLTLCMFSDDEIGLLFRISEGFKMLCSPIIDIGPSLDVWHCFPLSEVLVMRFDEFSNRNDIVHYYKKLTEPYFTLGCMPKCTACKYLKTKQCTGGCLAHAMNSLSRKPQELVERGSL